RRKRFGARLRGKGRSSATFSGSPLSRLLAGEPASAFDNVDGEAATGGFLVLVEHVAPGVAHGLDGLVQRDKMTAVTAKGDTGGADGLDGGHGVAFDAGDLD